MDDSRAQVCIVENDAQLQKIIKVAPTLKCTQLLAIVQYFGDQVKKPPQDPNGFQFPPIYTVQKEFIIRYKTAFENKFVNLPI